MGGPYCREEEESNCGLPARSWSLYRRHYVAWRFNFIEFLKTKFCRHPLCPPEGKDSRTDATAFIILYVSVPETKKTHKDGQRHTVCRISSPALSCMFIDLRLCDLTMQYLSYGLGHSPVVMHECNAFEGWQFCNWSPPVVRWPRQGSEHLLWAFWAVILSFFKKEVSITIVVAQ